jgi:putative ABC transport system permease protein
MPFFMFKNYWILGWRNLIRRPFFSTLNILSICTGLLFVLTIGVYIWGEQSINRHLKNARNQYILTTRWKNKNQGMAITTLGPVARELKEKYPGLVKNYYRGDFISSVVSKGDQHLRESIDIGDSTLFQIYGFPLLYGDPGNALQEPYSVVVRKELALKYFGRTNVLGETLNIQGFTHNNHDFRITGVLDQIPENSVTDINFFNHHQLFIPANTAHFFSRNDREKWDNIYVPSFIETQDGVDPAQIRQAVNNIVAKNAPDQLRENLSIEPVALIDYHLQQDNHLVQKMLYALSILGGFILLMAIVNFVNITISGSSSRIKEIGIRKVMGSQRYQLITQFLTESIFLVAIAAILAIVLYPVTKPYFESMVGKSIPDLTSFPKTFWLVPVSLVILIGLAAGFYPAIVLSALQAVDSVKGKFKSVKEHIGLRKVLVGLQFSLASLVFITALIVTRQVRYFFGQELGYDKDKIITAQLPRDWTPEGVHRMQTIRDEFSRMPQVEMASLSYEIPDGMNGGSDRMYRADMDSLSAIAVQLMVSDEFFLKTYKVPMVAGRYYTPEDGSDPTRVVINATAVRALGWSNPAEALGRLVRFPGFPERCTIIGVSGDYHFGSMQEKIPPMVFAHIRLTNTYRYLSFKLAPGNTFTAIKSLADKWSALLPGSSLEYNFMDDTLRTLYRLELQLKNAADLATVICILIALLGMIGLVALSIQKRSREIGIRKVLGASLPGIILLFVNDFIGVIILSGLVTCPIAWILGRQWLDNYAYRVTITPVPFLVAIVSICFISVAAILVQAFRLARINPADTLKSD